MQQPPATDDIAVHDQIDVPKQATGNEMEIVHVSSYYILQLILLYFLQKVSSWLDEKCAFLKSPVSTVTCIDAVNILVAELAEIKAEASDTLTQLNSVEHYAPGICLL